MKNWQEVHKLFQKFYFIVEMCNIDFVLIGFIDEFQQQDALDQSADSSQPVKQCLSYSALKMFVLL